MSRATKTAARAPARIARRSATSTLCRARSPGEFQRWAASVRELQRDYRAMCQQLPAGTTDPQLDEVGAQLARLLIFLDN